MTTSQSEWQRHSDMQVTEIKRLEALCHEYHAQLQVCRDDLARLEIERDRIKTLFERIYEASK